MARHPLNIAFTVPQPTHCTQSVARKLHLQEEMSVDRPGRRVYSLPNIQRSDHNHTAKPSDATDQQLMEWQWVCLRGSLCRSEWKDGHACGPAVVLTAHLVSFVSSKHHMCVTGKQRATYLCGGSVIIWSVNLAFKMTFMLLLGFFLCEDLCV